MRSTWVACLTPPGTAAIAVVAVRGPDAWHITRRLFQPFSKTGKGIPETADSARTWLGRFGDSTGPADEVLLAVRRTTPEPWLEIQCHGGAEVVRWVTEMLTAAGATACSWEELEQHSVEDPLRAAALAALVRAPTVRTAGILLDQYQGAFARAIRKALAALDGGDHARAEELLKGLVQHCALGSHLTTPWRVAVAGAPNVGKSSLVNAMAGYQRSLVSPLSGTTRDVITTLIAADGWPIELMDTAGVRAGTAGLENEGIALGQNAVREADLCLWVMDAAADPVWPVAANPEVRLVVNKMDLPPTWNLDQAAGAMCVWARTGAGIADLVQALARWLVPDPPAAGVAVPFTPRLVQAVKDALRAWAMGDAVRTRHILQEMCEPL